MPHAGEHHYAGDRCESDEQQARRIIEEELRHRHWKPEGLARRRKGDPGKVLMALRLREETTMTLKWVADALHMGAWTRVSNLLSQERQKSKR